MPITAASTAASPDPGLATAGDHRVGAGHDGEAGTGGSTLFENVRNDVMRQSTTGGPGPRHLSRRYDPGKWTDRDGGIGRAHSAEDGPGHDGEGAKGAARFSQMRATRSRNSLLPIHLHPQTCAGGYDTGARLDRESGSGRGRWPGRDPAVMVRAGMAAGRFFAKSRSNPKRQSVAGKPSPGCLSPGYDPVRRWTATAAPAEADGRAEVRLQWCRSAEPGAVTGARGAIRESRQRPYGPSCGGVGSKPGRRSADQGAAIGASGAIRESRQRPYGPPRGGVGSKPGRRSADQGPAIGARDAIRESRQRPYGPPCGGVGGKPRRRSAARGCPVMAGLDPAIATGTGREVRATDRGYGGCGDGRVKPGHDGGEGVCLTHTLILTPMGAVTDARGAIREFRQRPYGTPCGGLGDGTGGRGRRSGTWTGGTGAIRESRQRPY